MTAIATHTERWFDVDGLRLHGVEWGNPDGTPMLMLHGVGSNAHFFNSLGPRLEQRLPGQYRILSLDHRGSGDSDKPETGYGIERAAQDVLDIHDQLGGAPMVLVGHSRGGWLGPYIAGRWPERVSELVLIDPARIFFATTQDADDFYGAVGSGMGPFDTVDDALAAAREKDTTMKWTADREAAVRAGLEELPDGRWQAKMPRSVLAALRAAREDTDQVGPVLPDVTARVLMFVSSRSNEWRQQQKLEYARLLPDGVRVELVDATHAIHQDEPDLVADTITDFLRPEQ